MSKPVGSPSPIKSSGEVLREETWAMKLGNKYAQY